MLVRGATLALLLGAGSLGIGAVAACAGESPPSCATSVAPEVCESPGSLRGVEAIEESSSQGPAPELQPEPLLDGRYVQTASTAYCPAGYQPPATEPAPRRSVVEISGCVMRSSAVAPGGENPYVSVVTFRYREDGTLELQPACGAEAVALEGRRYGFDGTTLQWVSDVQRTGSDGVVYECQLVDTFEPD